MDKLVISLIIIAIVLFFYFRSNMSNEIAEKNKAIGLAFLIKNKVAEGVVETSSGLQYLNLNQTSNNELEKTVSRPGPKDKVKVHYHGTLLDGTVFDSSVNRGQPISFALNQVITGWTEGLQLMAVGDKTRFFIPANLAYGNRSTGKIEAGSLLIFDVELLAVNE